MIKITVTPPNKPSFSQEFFGVPDAAEFLEVLRVYGYEAAREAAQQGVEPTVEIAGASPAVANQSEGEKPA